MRAVYSSEMSVDFQRTARCSIPEDSTVQKIIFTGGNILLCVCVWLEMGFGSLTGRTKNDYNTTAISTLYSSLLYALASSVYYSLHCPFSGHGF
jgi:hypothetical protein